MQYLGLITSYFSILKNIIKIQKLTKFNIISSFLLLVAVTKISNTTDSFVFNTGVLVKKISALFFFFNPLFRVFLKSAKKKLLKKVFRIFFFKKKERARFKFKLNLANLFFSFKGKPYINKKKFKKRRLKRKRFKVKRIKYFKKNSSMFLHMTKKIVFSNSRLLVLNFYKHYLHFSTLRSNVRACFFINTFSELNNTQSTVVFVSQEKSMKKKFNLRLFNLKLSIKNALTLFNNFY